jgi:flagellar hook-length control protein FliK
MAGSMIDTLLQTVAAPRTAEPARATDNRGGGSEFRPVLDEALTTRPKSAEPIDEPDVVVSDDIQPPESANSSPENDCADCALPRESNEQETDADDAGAVTVSDDANDDGETDEDAGDAVEISQAAAAAAAEAAQPKAATAMAPVDDGDAQVATLTPANGDQENSGGDAAAKKAAEASQESAQATEIEIGDVHRASPKLAGDAPPDLSTLEAAVGETKRKAGAAKDKTDEKTKEAPRAKSNVGATQQDENDGAPSVTASGDEAVVSDDATSEDKALREAEVAEVVSEKEAPKPSARDRNEAPASQQSFSSQRELTDVAPTSEAAAAPAAPAATSDDGNATPAVASVPTHTTHSNESSAENRRATTIARLSAERSLQTNGGQGDDVDAARFIGRVEGAVRAAHLREGRVQVRLSPPELGALRIELTIQNGVLSARLEAETPAARNLLLDNLPALRDRLAQQDVRIDQFDVDVRRDDGGSAGGNAGQNGPGDRPAQESGWQQRQQRQDRGGPALAKRDEPTRRDAAATDAALDVRV